MVAHYTRERSKYGTLTGSVIVWPVEFTSPTSPNSPESIAALPAGYLRCNGAKYNAKDYPQLAAICGTGSNCKFQRFDENNEPIIQLGDDEFLVPDLGSKYPRAAAADAGVYNNIIEETVNKTFIKRSGIGVQISSNVGSLADVTYSGKFIIPSQTISLKGKPSWTWGNAKYTDEESVDNRAIHPHMHFSSTNRVRIKPKSGATGGVIELEDILYNANDSSLNPSYSGASFVGFGTGTGETGGFTNPNLGTSGYVAFGGTYSSSLVSTRSYTVTLNFTGNYNLLLITSIVGNDSNGGERINNSGEGLYVIWPSPVGKSTQPLIPSRQESGLSQGAWDSRYASWAQQTIPIPTQFRGSGNQTITITQTLVATADELQAPDDTDPSKQNCYDMAGIAQIGISGGYTEDPSLVGGENDFTGGENYFFGASTLNINKWLEATSLDGVDGKNQPACWAIASGNNPWGQAYSGSIQITWVWNFCLSGCDLGTLGCYCILNQPVTYKLADEFFGNQGGRYGNYVIAFGICTAGPNAAAGVPVTESATAPATYFEGARNVPVDYKGISLADVLPLNSNVLEEKSYPQAKNTTTEVEEPTSTVDDPTAHNHKIVVERLDHNFAIVTDPVLLEPDALNTTVQLTPSNIASIDGATSPFIVLEYLIKT